MAAMGSPSSRADRPFTRREWTALLSAVPMAAQTGPLPAAPTTPSSSSGLEKAIEGVNKVSSRLAQLEVPMNVEPAFSFKA